MLDQAVKAERKAVAQEEERKRAESLRSMMAEAVRGYEREIGQLRSTVVWREEQKEEEVKVAPREDAMTQTEVKEAPVIFQLKRETQLLRKFDIESKELANFEIGFKFPKWKACVHLGSDFVVAGGRIGDSSVDNVWKFNSAGLMEMR